MSTRRFDPMQGLYQWRLNSWHVDLYTLTQWEKVGGNANGCVSVGDFLKH